MTKVYMVFFGISVVFFLYYWFNAILCITKRNDYRTAYRIAAAGTAGASLFYFFPFYTAAFNVTGIFDFFKSLLNIILLSAHHAIRLFVVDASFEEIDLFASELGIFGKLYTSFGIVLLVVAPILTFTGLASFLKVLLMNYYVWFSFGKNHYIFSELNLQSLYLAHDIVENDSKASIVFMSFNKEEDSEMEYVKSHIRSFRPVFLPNHIIEIDHLLKKRGKSAKFFIIGDDHLENAAAAISMMSSHGKKGKREIYVRLKMNDHLLDDIPQCENTEIFRIEHIYSTVIKDLEAIGVRLFDSASENKKGEKVISALVVGLGEYGTEMVKNLSWLTQAEGYRTVIHAVDMDPAAEDRFCHLCPGLFGEDTADRHCEVVIHSDVAVGTASFDRLIEEIGDVGLVFVALGDDNANVNASYGLRALLQKAR